MTFCPTKKFRGKKWFQKIPGEKFPDSRKSSNQGTICRYPQLNEGKLFPIKNPIHGRKIPRSKKCQSEHIRDPRA